eukprot:g773.t1
MSKSSNRKAMFTKHRRKMNRKERLRLLSSRRTEPSATGVGDNVGRKTKKTTIETSPATTAKKVVTASYSEPSETPSGSHGSDTIKTLAFPNGSERSPKEEEDGDDGESLFRRGSTIASLIHKFRTRRPMSRERRKAEEKRRSRDGQTESTFWWKTSSKDSTTKGQEKSGATEVASSNEYVTDSIRSFIEWERAKGVDRPTISDSGDAMTTTDDREDPVDNTRATAGGIRDRVKGEEEGGATREVDDGHDHNNLISLPPSLISIDEIEAAVDASIRSSAEWSQRNDVSGRKITNVSPLSLEQDKDEGEDTVPLLDDDLRAFDVSKSEEIDDSYDDDAVLVNASDLGEDAHGDDEDDVDASSFADNIVSAFEPGDDDSSGPELHVRAMERLDDILSTMRIDVARKSSQSFSSPKSPTTSANVDASIVSIDLSVEADAVLREWEAVEREHDDSLVAECRSSGEKKTNRRESANSSSHPNAFVRSETAILASASSSTIESSAGKVRDTVDDFSSEEREDILKADADAFAAVRRLQRKLEAVRKAFRKPISPPPSSSFGFAISQRVT